MTAWASGHETIHQSHFDRLRGHMIAARVHPSASVAPTAVLKPGVVVHEFVVIADGVTLEEGVEVFPGAFVGKEPKGAGATARQPSFTPRTHVGANSTIGPHTTVYYDVVIGQHCLIGDGASIREQCRLGDRVLLSRAVTVNYATTIGNGTKVMDNTHLTGLMTVGEGVFIGPGVMTANDNALGKRDYDADSMTGPTIEDGATVGLGAGILPSVRIGRDAVVGAMALVTRDVPPGAIVMGVPARVLGT